jgi:hypothetical protein
MSKEKNIKEDGDHIKISYSYNFYQELKNIDSYGSYPIARYSFDKTKSIFNEFYSSLLIGSDHHFVHVTKLYMNKENKLLNNRNFSFLKNFITPMSTEIDNSVKIINNNFSIFEKDSNVASIEYVDNKDNKVFTFANTRKEITVDNFKEIFSKNKITSYPIFKDYLKYHNYIFSSSMDYLIDFYKSLEEKENFTLEPFGGGDPTCGVDINMA